MEVASVYAFRLRHHTFDEILIGSALLPDESGTLRPHLILHPDRDLYAVRPDGSDLHRVLTQQPCFLPLGVGSFFSPDGQWFLCGDERHLDRLWIARLPPSGEETQWTPFPVTVKADWWDITWSPDGRQVAAPLGGEPCTVGLFDLTFAPLAVRLSRTLVLPDLASSSFCELRWSPDGRYLALSEAQHDNQTVRQYIVDLTALPAPDAASEGAPRLTLSTAHTPHAVRYLGAYDGSAAYGAVWLGDSSALVINEDAQTLAARGVHGELWEPILQVPYQRGSRLCAISNVALTMLVAFSYCFLYTVDGPNLIPGQGERLYVFDPAAV
jgi:hypothetical protein